MENVYLPLQHIELTVVSARPVYAAQKLTKTERTGWGEVSLSVVRFTA